MKLGRILLATAALAMSPPLPAARLAPEVLATALGRVVLADGLPAPAGVVLIREWTGELGRFALENRTNAAVRVKEVVLFDLVHGFAPDTPFYGEGFTMLSQTGGTLAAPVDFDEYTDRKLYKLPESPGLRTVYGLLRVGPVADRTHLLAFTSCRRFVGQFRVNGKHLQIALNTEGLTLPAGARWELEELTALAGPDQNVLLEQVARRINDHHPRLSFPRLPAGWCSWYCFGPKVTREDILGNLAVARAEIPQLRYIQIDDGYQPTMGDWLETGKAFGGSVQQVLLDIRAAGFEPAIWVAPFIASSSSNLFREHPEWFIQDDEGRPLPADSVTSGGWRLGPWYMLDGTHPGAQRHLEEVFRTMREQWGCTYFKLDANAWGAFPFGRRHDSAASHVEAFRRGMAAIRRGASDAFLLGCNQAMWPSFGETHGSRSSMDVVRSWANFIRIGRENLTRNWQNDRLWWNDPDCVVLTGKLPANEYDFHRTVAYASGGMLLSGDDLTTLDAAQKEQLRRLAANPGAAARFTSDTLDVGVISQPGRTVAVFLNWSDTPAPRTLPLTAPMQAADFWTGEDLGRHERAFHLEALPARSGRLIILTPAR